MWTVLKIKGNKIAERSPYFREVLFFVRYTLIYGGNEELLQKLRVAFQDPAYPLSLGREDELAVIEEATLTTASKGKPLFGGTILPGDIRQMPKLRPVLRPGVILEPPIVETLPLGFEVDARGVRSPIAPMPFSFLPFGMELEVPECPWQPLCLKDRNFVWLNQR
jgi:CRISPR-associated protein Cas5t/CRISPR-associated protein Cas5h